MMKKLRSLESYLATENLTGNIGSFDLSELKNGNNV